MRNKDMKPGMVVAVRIGDRIVPVELDAYYRASGFNRRGHWGGRNIATGRHVRLTAARARYPMVGRLSPQVPGDKGRATDWVRDTSYRAAEPKPRKPRPSVVVADGLDDVTRLSVEYSLLRYAIGLQLWCRCGAMLDCRDAVLVGVRDTAACAVLCGACYGVAAPQLREHYGDRLETTDGRTTPGTARMVEGMLR